MRDHQRISTTIVLLGSEITAELQQQTDRDSLLGQEQPEGAHGACKAGMKP